MCFVSLLQPAKKKQRAQVIEFFIDVARECFNIGNFNSLMAIICELFILQSLSIDSRLVFIVKNIYIYIYIFFLSWDEHESCVPAEEDLEQS